MLGGRIQVERVKGKEGFLETLLLFPIPWCLGLSHGPRGSCQDSWDKLCGWTLSSVQTESLEIMCLHRVVLIFLPCLSKWFMVAV